MKSIKIENLRVKGDASALKSQRTIELQAGMSVRVCGLKAAPQLNGQEATLERWDAAIGRWHVTFSNGEMKALKAENLCEGAGSDAKRARVEKPVAVAPPREASREELKRHVFWRCDQDADGFLNREEMLAFAKLSGFDGTEIQWRTAYRELCNQCQADPEVGVPEATLSELLDDRSEAGFYCTDAELKSFQ